MPPTASPRTTNTTRRATRLGGSASRPLGCWPTADEPRGHRRGAGPHRRLHLRALHRVRPTDRRRPPRSLAGGRYLHRLRIRGRLRSRFEPATTVAPCPAATTTTPPGDPGPWPTRRVARRGVGRHPQSGATRFPGPDNRIPNFVGAEAAAELLRGTDAWQRARTVKANPDSPQLPVRQRALEDGITCSWPSPPGRGKPFFLLDPELLDVKPRRPRSIKGAGMHGHTVDIDELEPVDLVVTGCVAVDESGARLGKGGGFSDLEYARGVRGRVDRPEHRRGDDGARGAAPRPGPHPR